MKTSVLKPGLLVSLKTSVRGGVNYQRVDLEADHIAETGEKVARWETKRVIVDPVEFEAAGKVRNKARSLISAACCGSGFGLLCPASNEGALEKAIAEARELAQAHNLTAATTHVDVFVLVGRIAADDVEAAKAIGSEVRELLDAMKDAVEAADVARIRDAANKARELGTMLSPEVATKVSLAVVQARSAAREIVRRVEKEAESAAVVVAGLSVSRINEARFAFLDLEEGQAQQVAQAGRSVEMGPDEFDAANLPLQARAPQLEV